MGEVRYASLQQSFPEIAEELFEKQSKMQKNVELPMFACKRALNKN